MRAKAEIYTQSTDTKTHLTDAKKARLRLEREKLLRLLTLEKLQSLPLPGELHVDEPMKCLWHDDENPSMRGWISTEGYPLWKCYTCNRAFTGIDVVGLAYGLDGKAAWKKAIEICGGRAALAGVTISVGEQAAGERGAPRWPPRAEVRAVLSQPRPAYAEYWFEERGLNFDFAVENELCFSSGSLEERHFPWKGGRWGWEWRGYELLFPTLSADGQRVSVRVRQTGTHRTTSERGSQKVLAPSGFTCAGTVLANAAAWQLLLPTLTVEERELIPLFIPGASADPAPLATSVEIAEGEPDFLRRCESAAPGTAVFGVFSGAWTQAHADRIPDGAIVKIFTHSDAAGMEYQHHIAESLRGRCQILVRHQREKLCEKWIRGTRKKVKLPDEVDLFREYGPIAYAAMGSDGMAPYLGREEQAAPAAPVASATAAPVAPVPAPRPGRPSAADRLVQICDARGLRVRADGSGIPCAEVVLDGAGGGLPHPLPLKSARFSALLRRWLDEAGGGTASDSTIKRAVETLAARVEVDLLAGGVTEAPELWTSDADNATRLERHVAGKAIHSPAGWLALSDGIWDRDPKAITRLAEEAMRKIPVEAEGLSDEAADALRRWGLRSLSESAIKSAISLASARESLSVDEEDLDKDDLLLGTLSGVLDLSTGSLVPDPARHRVTRRVPVRWEPAARAPRWERFLDEIFEGDAEIVSFVQRCVGYFLTGATREQKAIFLHGPRARNGKSTLVDVLVALLGDLYSHKANHTLLSSLRARGTHDTDRDQMRGRRLTIVDEWPRGAGFDEAKFKSATGGRVQSGRDIGKSESNFRSTTKILIASNFLVEAQGDDAAVWARILIVPFRVSFLGRENRGLYDALVGELPEILAWAVAGARSWLQRGLDAPAVILEYTEKCRSEMDDLGRWASERLIFEEGATATPTELAASWASWCEAAQVPAGAATRMTSRTAVGVVCARWGLAEKKGRTCSRVAVGVRVAPVGAAAPLGVPRATGAPTADDLDRLLGQMN